MRAHRQRGVSLVELMVAVVIAIITVLVVLEVLATYEARKRTTTIGNDAEISAATGLFALERDVRMAGAGLTLPNSFACNVGVNLFFGAAGTFSDGAVLAPLRIIDGGAGPDQIRVIRSDANFGPAPATIVTSMAAADSNVLVDWNGGLARGDLFLAGSPDGNKICTVMQLTRAPQASGSGFSLEHSSANPANHNPASPGTAFTTAIRYDVGDTVTNLGTFGLRTYAVLCGNGAAPGLDNACNLVSFNTLAVPAPTLANVESISTQVVDLQAQYGVAPANSQTVDAWVDATLDPLTGVNWAAPTALNLRRIKAVRLAIVTRGNLEREMVSPATLVLWDRGLATERTIALNNDQRRYRYKVLTVVVPLINVIWAGV